MKQQFSQRQIKRLATVGSNPATGPTIEAAYARLLDLLDAHFQRYPFLLGARPGAADFALYGQMSQLALFDPSSMAVTLRHSRRAFAWVGLMEDLSGLEPAEDDWIKADALPETLIAILQEVGRGYVPMMLANAKALLTGAEEFQTVIDGAPWSQAPVNYQGKCLRWLREEFAALSVPQQAAAAEVLERGHCASLIFEPLSGNS
jgi:hypothetical protein